MPASRLLGFRRPRPPAKQAALLTQTPVVPPSQTVVVQSKRSVAANVVQLRLAPLPNCSLAPWMPGSHIDLHLPDGMVRQYSLCGDPDDRAHYDLAVLRQPDGRGGSVYIHDHVEVGDTLTVSLPRNNFGFVPAERYLFIAGGIGITPILPMITAANRGGMPWTLHYGGRTAAGMAFTQTLAAYGDRVHLATEDTSGILDLDRILRTSTSGTQVYACGPEGLLQTLESLDHLLPPASLHTERFRATPAREVDTTSTELTVHCARSGIDVTVEPDRSILESLEDAGIEVASSCREGICGTCETGVLDGVPEHRDSVLSAAERAAGNRMLICVSRATTDHLTLDT
ncbi:PDR/VanB family oxidoreductase (plasmid) [Prescottella equi]|uniref:PDR/VanB family oxidoreductase n=1 Tax=Rhodococcus hoagii TaxID=43767 RepID=UPI002574F30B|nr:PDR/VanB family oxidoreductase [Prescottella equi]WJJ14457.1 PDR/VanB family oxidoreductase [Prescottella equi]